MKHSMKQLCSTLICGFLAVALLSELSLASAAGPMDAQAYSTNRSLIVNGVAIPGIVEIGGEPFIPAESLNGIPGGVEPIGVYFREKYATYYDAAQQATFYDVNEVESYEISTESIWWPWSPVAAEGYSEGPSLRIVDTVTLPVARWPIGQAVPSGKSLFFTRGVSEDENQSHYYDDSELWEWADMNDIPWTLEWNWVERPRQVAEELTDAVYLLDGEYPMIRLSALGIADTGGDIVWNTCDMEVSIQKEEDLVGQAVKGLIRDSARETVKAIHDYVVNTLTYDPGVAEAITRGSMSASEQAKRAAGGAFAAAEKYHVANNFTLASRYGICNDYANLFGEMCLRAGIPCVKVSGYAYGAAVGGHAWNKVYLDGKWQYVDCTFDDPVSSNGKPILEHTNFLVDANFMVMKHIWNGSDCPMPRYYDPSWEQIDPSNIKTADEFRKCTAAQIHQGKTTFTLTVSNSAAYGGKAGLIASGNWYGSKVSTYSERVNGKKYTYNITYR